MDIIVLKPIVRNVSARRTYRVPEIFFPMPLLTGAFDEYDHFEHLSSLVSF